MTNTIMNNRIIKLFISIISIFAAVSCGQKNVYTCQDGSRVRITAVTEDIIHVEAVPAGASFSTEP